MSPSESLALLGGRPVLPRPLPPFSGVGEAERRAVDRVLSSGCLSGFHGSPGPRFGGGAEVRALEREWADRFGVRHAVSVNSATSGLMIALGAIGLAPGDEVIVPPTTMSATAVAPLVYGGVPVFADVEEQTFCLDPVAVRAAITPRTRAIVAVSLFGHPAPLHVLRALADEHGIALIEDCAQAPLAAEDGRLAGTVGDVGVFSLNYHKHVHAGEGGICVTDDDDLAERLQLLRNHGENVVEDLGRQDLFGLFGFNFRLTEMSAAVARAQLERIDELVARVETAAEALTGAVAELEGLTPPVVRPGCRHVWHVWAMRFDERRVGIDRASFARAVAAEGMPLLTGYVRPLYRLPVFRREPRYAKVHCSVAERLHERELVGFEACLYDVDEARAAALAASLRKVHAHRGRLRSEAERAA